MTKCKVRDRTIICLCQFHFRTTVLEEVELLEAIYINELTVVPDDEYVQIVFSPKVINDLTK